MMIRKVAVVGAGMMGKGIAQVCTNIEGVKVCLYDVKDVDIYQDIQKDFGMLGDCLLYTSAFKTSVVKRARFSLEPPNSSVLSLVSGDKNWFSR